MPLGLVNSAERDPTNFSRAEWQQAKRADHDPAVLKETFQDCWATSDSCKAFAQALAARGLYLARGDRRGFVAVNIKGTLHFTRRAREDLLDIWIHIALRRSEAVADRVYDRIEGRCQLLRHQPMLGPARPEIGEGAQILVIDRWLALYQFLNDGVQVVRIVDGACDLAGIEWTPEKAAAAEARDLRRGHDDLPV